MTVSRALLVILSLVIKPSIFVSSNFVSRNVLHFGLKDNWVGRPAAFLNTTSGILAHIYEKRRFKGLTADNKTVFDLGRSTSKDGGLTWQEQDDFLNGAKLSLENDMSITAGGILQLPNATPGKYYAVAYGIRNTNGNEVAKIHTRFAGESFAINIIEEGYEAVGITPSLFDINRQVYVAYLPSDKDCKVHIAKAEAGAKVDYQVDLPMFKACLSPQLFQLDKDKFAVIVSALDDTGHFYRSYYVLGQMTEAGELAFNSDKKYFDVGRDVNGFRVSKINRKIVAIGWNGNDAYISRSIGGLTLPRELSFDDKRQLLKQDPWARVGSTTHSVWWNTTLPKYTFMTYNFTGNRAMLFELEIKEGSGSPHLSSPSVFYRFVQTLSNGTKVRAAYELVAHYDGPRKWSYSVSVSRDAGTFKTLPTLPPVGGQIILPDINGKLKMVLDRSTVEIYGEGGYYSLSDHYHLKSEEPFSELEVYSITNLMLNAKITTLREKTTTSPRVPNPTIPPKPHKTGNARTISGRFSILVGVLLSVVSN